MDSDHAKMLYDSPAMIIHPVQFYISVIQGSRVPEAVRFHQKMAAGDGHLWPRSEEDFIRWASDGCLFGAWDADANVLVAVCYSYLEEAGQEWEVGGLVVEPASREHGIGSVLVQFAMAHTIVFNTPYDNNQTIIAYVHEQNDAPRNLLERLGFIGDGEVEVPAERVPEGMARNQNGNLAGDRFAFSRAGLRKLADEFSPLADGEAITARGGIGVAVKLGRLDTRDFARALQETAARFGRDK